MTALRRPTVLLADDHLVFINAIARLLADHFEVVGQVNDGLALCDAIGRLHPAVVVSDISMQTLDGFQGLRRLRGTLGQSRLIFLTMHADPRLAIEALRLGASGFVLKQHSGAELVRAVEAVLRGEQYVTPTLGADMVSLSSRLES